jgi:hypothetical protein
LQSAAGDAANAAALSYTLAEARHEAEVAALRREAAAAFKRSGA